MISVIVKQDKQRKAYSVYTEYALCCRWTCHDDVTMYQFFAFSEARRKSFHEFSDYTLRSASLTSNVFTFFRRSWRLIQSLHPIEDPFSEGAIDRQSCGEVEKAANDGPHKLW